jgi:hypothetical protein
MSASTVSPRGDRRLAVRAIDVAGPVVHHCLGRATCPVVAVPLEAPAKIHKSHPSVGTARDFEREIGQVASSRGGDSEKIRQRLERH